MRTTRAFRDLLSIMFTLVSVSTRSEGRPATCTTECREYTSRLEGHLYKEMDMKYRQSLLHIQRRQNFPIINQERKRLLNSVWLSIQQNSECYGRNGCLTRRRSCDELLTMRMLNGLRRYRAEQSVCANVDLFLT